MKALTIRPPWPGLIRVGIKDIETRTWKTSYRGPLLIHAGKKIDKSAVEMLTGFSLSPEQLDTETTGVIIAVCYLVEIKEYKTPVDFLRDYDRHLCQGYARYGWVLKNVTPLENPIPYKGKQGLWEATNIILNPWKALENV
jgi:hypothetical protein